MIGGICVEFVLLSYFVLVLWVVGDIFDVYCELLLSVDVVYVVGVLVDVDGRVEVF